MLLKQCGQFIKSKYFLNLSKQETRIRFFMNKKSLYKVDALFVFMKYIFILAVSYGILFTHLKAWEIKS